MTEIGNIENAIRTLPLGEQMAIYRRLAQYLFGDDDKGERFAVHPAVIEEMERRLADYQAGREIGLPAAIGMAEARKRLRDGNTTA